MIYSRDCEIPKDTPPTIPEPFVLKVTRGLVYKVELEFPDGCAGMVHLVVYDGGHQVWPSDPENTFHADGYTISFDDTYLKLEPPYQFDIYGHSARTVHKHTPVVRIGLVSKEIFMARFLPTYAYEYFVKMLEELRLEQEARAQEAARKPFGWIEE